MRIYIVGIFVDDQAKALEFYTNKLGFKKKHDIPVGDARWLTVVSAGGDNDVELSLEPDGHPAVSPFRKALMDDGIPFTSFQVDDIQSEFERLKGEGVTFTLVPTEMDDVTVAVFDDTCGNLIQLAQMKS